MQLTRLITSTAGLVAVAALSIGAAHANQIEFDGGSFQSGDGGEFQVSVLDSAGLSLLDTSSDSTNTDVGGYFQTFCLEKDEHLNFTAQYGFTLSTEADAGGANTNNGDPLGGATAWLYTKFWNGTLTDYNWNNTDRDDSAKELQEAIWFLEDELFDDEGNAYTLSDLSSTASHWVENATAAMDNGDWSGLGNVRVLNLTRNDGERHQDVLAMVASTSVPATPLPLLFWSGLLLVGGGIVISRRRKPQGGAFRDGGLAT